MWRKLTSVPGNWGPKIRILSTEAGTAGADDEFRVLDIIKSKTLQRQMRKKRERRPVPPPRYLKMDVKQDWPSVWPVAKTFNPSAVPLPLHQGYVPDHLPPLGKFANLELMKIHNFLHLTPPAIARHCQALKKFCTEWPKELENTEDAFPMEVIYTDYIHSSPTIRDFRARIVTTRIKLGKLTLDETSKDKFYRLVGEYYDTHTDYVTIVTKSCPLRQQNEDYGLYLFTALYHESKSRDSWEKEKIEADMEKYVWEDSVSFKRINNYKVDSSEYSQAVTKLHNEGENLESIEEYGKSVRKMFNLPV